jgi:cytochrome P450
LAANPDAQKKLQAEIDGELKQGEEITPHTFDRLPYLKAVLKESQRQLRTAASLIRIYLIFLALFIQAGSSCPSNNKNN